MLYMNLPQEKGMLALEFVKLIIGLERFPLKTIQKHSRYEEKRSMNY